MHNAIEIRDLRYAYPDDQAAEHVVFEDLNLDIRQGSFVAVLGHNGCGKSTLAKHLNAILLPEGGSVMVYGLDTKQEENLLAIRQQVGMVFQNPDNQIVSNGKSRRCIGGNPPPCGCGFGGGRNARV